MKIRTRVLSALLALCTLTGGVLTSCKDDKNDKYEDEAYMKGHEMYLDCTEHFDTENAFYLLYSGNEDDYSDASLWKNTEIKADGATCSGYWKNQETMTSLSFPYFPTSTQGYDCMVMNVYSEKATGKGLVVCINCQNNTNVGKGAYLKYDITVDWTGWKQIVIDIAQMGKAYSPDTNAVSSVVINASGWGNTPSNDTKLYFDNVFWTTKTVEYNYDISELGDYNYDHVKETLVELITGGVKLNKADENAQSKLNSYVSSAKSSADSMNTSGLPWDFDMKTTAGITSCYQNIYNMARGYAVEGGDTYHDDKLFKKIKTAMEYMHEHYYKDQSLNSYPSRDNWWDWEIGSAQHIVNILLLCGDAFTQDEIDKYLEPVNKYVPYPSMTMANLVDLAYVCLGASALQKDAERMVISRNKLDECCGFVMDGDGFYEDGSFIQHDVIAYTGSYGPIMLEALSKLILALDDTCFHVKDEVLDAQYGWAISSFVPLMYHGAFFGMVRGRSICRSSTDVTLGGTAVSGMLRMTKYVDATRAKIIKEILLEYANYSDAYYMSALSPYDIVIYKDIKADKSVSAREDSSLTKVFAMMDRAVSVNNSYGVGISLSSSRIAKYESINEENGKGWYTGDGMLYIYTTVNDYDANYWKNINYYRIPGTTVTTAKRADVNIDATKTLSQYDFVGGSYLGNTMTVAMQFESATTDMKSNGMFTSTLKGKKAWFVFDNEIVCLGAGISCSDNYSTETIIENRRLDSTEKLYVNGSVVSGNKGALNSCSSVWFSSFGGVYMPEGTTVNYNRTSSSFLELYIDHGKNISSDTYAYVLLPTMTKEQTDSYCASPEINILSNTADIQAVYDSSSNTTGYVFWKAGTFGDVTVSAPCTLTISGNTVAVADPTMELNTLTITVNGHTFEVSPEKGQTYTFTF